MAPTHERIVPLAIADLIRAKNVLQVYGIQGLDKHNQGYVMVHNYPVKVVKIAGRVLSYAFKSFDEGDVKRDYNFFLVDLDDCSGDRLLICVRIMERDLPFPAKNVREGLLLEVIGSVYYFQDYDRQILALSVRIIGSSTELDVEIEWWAHVLETRRLLQVPWRCEQGNGDRNEKERKGGAAAKKTKNLNENASLQGAADLSGAAKLIETANIKAAANPQSESQVPDRVLTRAEYSRRRQKANLKLNFGSAEKTYSHPVCDSFTMEKHSLPEYIDLTLEADQDIERAHDLPVLSSFLLARIDLSSSEIEEVEAWDH